MVLDDTPSSSGTTGGQSFFGGQITQHQQLTRFFAKLLGEAHHLGADKVMLRGEGESFSAVILKDRAELKSVVLKPSWITPIHHWIDLRRSFSFQKQNINESEQNTFTASVKTGSRVLSFQVTRAVGFRGKETVTLSGFSHRSVFERIQELGVLQPYASVLDEIIAAERGLCIVCSPDENHLAGSVAELLATTDWCYAGGIPREGDIDSLLSFDVPVIIGVVAGEAVEALLKLREVGFPFRAFSVVGVLCQGFVQRVCGDCARKTVIDRSLVSHLPPGLRPDSNSSYHVGRGCEQCGQTGYKGNLGIQSLIKMDPQLLQLVSAGADHVKLVDYTFEKGTHPLVDDGIRKALVGLTTFESLNSLTRALPPVYTKFYGDKESRIPVDEGTPLSITDNFFAGASVGQSTSPLRGRAAFTGKPDLSATADDKPLFPAGMGGKGREKPLILVVEDDLDQGNILEMVLKTANYQVQVARNGVEGLKRLEHELPDLIVSDLMMPHMDGSEFVSRLKSHDIFRHIPVLMLTVVTDTEKEYALLNLGADDYCEKTIQRKILLKRVENLLKRTEGYTKARSAGIV